MGVEEPHRWRFHGDLRARVRAGDRDHDVVQASRAPGAYDRRAAFVCAERGQLGQRYAIFRKYEEKRWNPLAAVGTLLLAAVMYAGGATSFQTFLAAGSAS